MFSCARIRPLHGSPHVLTTEQSIFLAVITVPAASGLQQGKMVLAAWVSHCTHLLIYLFSPNKLLTGNTLNFGRNAAHRFVRKVNFGEDLFHYFHTVCFFFI